MTEWSILRPFVLLTPASEAETQDEVGSMPASVSFLFSNSCHLIINSLEMHTIRQILEKQIQSMVSTKMINLYVFIMETMILPVIIGLKCD